MADYRFNISLETFNSSLLPSGSPVRGSDGYSAAVHDFLQKQFAGFKGTARIVVSEESILVEWTPPSPKHDPIEAAVDRLEKGELVPAVLMLELLRQQMPNEVRLLYNLGMAYTGLGRLEEARSTLNEALRQNPRHINSLVALGVAYATEGRHREAVEVLERAVAADPNNPWAQKNLGGCLLALKEVDHATACLLRATQLNPKDQDAIFGLGEAYRLAGKLEEADAAYKQVVAINPFGKTAERAKKELSSLAHVSFMMQGTALGHPDAVVYCVKAIEYFERLSDKEVQRILYEVGMIGTKGFDINDTKQKYQLRSMPGTFSNLEMVCIMYVGFRRIAPEFAGSFDLSNEYEAAMEVVEKAQKEARMKRRPLSNTHEDTILIRIDLVDNSTSVKHIDFKNIPVTKESEFSCNPEGVLPLDSVVRLSRELKAGRTFGQSGKFVWYRLVGKPAATYKGVSCGME